MIALVIKLAVAFLARRYVRRHKNIACLTLALYDAEIIASYVIRRYFFCLYFEYRRTLRRTRPNLAHEIIHIARRALRKNLNKRTAICNTANNIMLMRKIIDKRPKANTLHNAKNQKMKRNIFSHSDFTSFLLA